MCVHTQINTSGTMLYFLSISLLCVMQSLGATLALNVVLSSEGGNSDSLSNECAVVYIPDFSQPCPLA